MIEERRPSAPSGFLMLNSSTRYDDRRYNKGDRAVADFGACYEAIMATSRAWRSSANHGRSQERSRDPPRDVIQLCFESMQPGTPIAELSLVRQPRTVETRLSGASTVPSASVMRIGMARADTAAAAEVETEVHRRGR